MLVLVIQGSLVLFDSSIHANKIKAARARENSIGVEVVPGAGAVDPNVNSNSNSPKPLVVIDGPNVAMVFVLFFFTK